MALGIMAVIFLLQRSEKVAHLESYLCQFAGSYKTVILVQVESCSPSIFAVVSSSFMLLVTMIDFPPPILEHFCLLFIQVAQMGLI